MDSPLLLAAAMAVFLVVFVKMEIGLYLVIFSMLLSPQFGAGGGGMIAESRRIVARSEDVLLLVVALPGLAQEETAPLPTTPARLAGRFA
jgi:hypothetical protein